MMLKILLLLLFVSCSSLPTTYEKQKIYRKDIKIKINGKSGEGLMVVPVADKYEIKIEAKDKVHLFTLRNCHRSLEAEKAWKNNTWFDKLDTKKAKVSIMPNSSIENDEYCPWDIGAWSISGRHSWGWIDINFGDKYSIDANILCNGGLKKYSGVSVCQAFAGTYQQIEFADEMEVLSSNATCKIDESVRKTFKFKIRPNICVYGFRDKKTKKRHRLTTYGYEYIMLRDL